MLAPHTNGLLKTFFNCRQFCHKIIPINCFGSNDMNGMNFYRVFIDLFRKCSKVPKKDTDKVLL